MKIFTGVLWKPLNSDVNLLILMSLLPSHGDTLYGGCKSLDLQRVCVGFFNVNVKNILAFHLRTELGDTDQTGDVEVPCWRPRDTAHRGVLESNGAADVFDTDEPSAGKEITYGQRRAWIKLQR